jgi:hypothetical protein
MTEAERALMQPPSWMFGWWTGLVPAACAFVLAFLTVSLAALSFPFDPVVRAAIAAAALAAAGTYRVVRRRARRRVKADADAAWRGREAGFVTSTIYTVTDAVAIEEREDEGRHYYLRLDDGRTLFLSGQYLSDPIEQGFPWQSFEVVDVNRHWVLKVVPLGPSLTPSLTRPPFTDLEFESDAVPDDRTIEQRDFEALKASTGRR